MKKTIFLIIILFIISMFIKSPKYVELNNLKIIDTIGIDCNNDTIYLREIIPTKDDNGIEYNYKLYIQENININNMYHKLNEKYKNLFIKDTKYFISNCNNYNEIIKSLNINPKSIKNTNNIKKKFK